MFCYERGTDGEKARQSSLSFCRCILKALEDYGNPQPVILRSLAEIRVPAQLVAGRGPRLDIPIFVKLVAIAPVELVLHD